MLSGGDVQGCLRKLETLLRVIKFPGDVDYSGLSKGEPSAFLPILSFTLTSFSPLFAEQLMADGLALAGKTDLRFTDTFFKVLRDVFHYKPVLTKQQFLQWGFSQRKISLICDIINLVLQKHNQLVKAKVKCPASHKNNRGEGQPTLTGAFVSKRGIAVNCIENHLTSTTNSSHTEVFTSHNINCIAKTEQNFSSSPEKVIMVAAAAGVENNDNIVHAKVKCPASHKNNRGEGQPTLTGAFVSKRGIAVNCIEYPSTSTTNSSHTEVFTSHNINCIAKTEQNFSSSPEKVIMVAAAAGVENNDNIVHLSEVEGRLSDLETKLETVLRGLGRLSILEKRLDELERRLNTSKVDNSSKNEGQDITICRKSWENLMSRVLLLETKLELNNIQIEEQLQSVEEH